MLVIKLVQVCVVAETAAPVQRFTEEHGRTPQQGEDRDVFGRLYAVRLDRMGELKECRDLVEPLDHQGLLARAVHTLTTDNEKLDDHALLAELDIEVEASLPPSMTSQVVRAATSSVRRGRHQSLSSFAVA